VPAVQLMTSLPGKATSEIESGSDAFSQEAAPITEGLLEAGESRLEEAGTEEVRLQPGAILRDTYRIDALIAMGGMGDVYRATQLRLQGQVAIKVLHRALMTDGEAMSRFRSEATMMAGLRHPHIAQVFDFNVLPDGTPYLVMELAGGPDLRSVLSNQHVLAPGRVAQIVQQTAAALGAAHAQDIIHRDLKPENVMLVSIPGQGDCVKVVDFGISKHGSHSHITVPSMVLGTPAFMAPEQARGLNELVDHRTDQFGLAAMAYTLFTGREPFVGVNAVAVLYQVVHEEPSPMNELVDWPCSRSQAVLQRALAKDPQDRFPDILSFARALEDAVVLDLATDPCAHCGAQTSETRRALAFAPTTDIRADEAALGATVPVGGIPIHRRTRRVRRKGHAGWRRALLIAGAAAAIAIGAEGGMRVSPNRVTRACGALSKGAAHLLDLAGLQRRAEAVLNPSATPAATNLLPQ